MIWKGPQRSVRASTARAPAAFLPLSGATTTWRYWRRRWSGPGMAGRFWDHGGNRHRQAAAVRGVPADDGSNPRRGPADHLRSVRRARRRQSSARDSTPSSARIACTMWSSACYVTRRTAPPAPARGSGWRVERHLCPSPAGQFREHETRPGRRLGCPAVTSPSPAQPG
jgi:hypothetical protein